MGYTEIDRRKDEFRVLNSWMYAMRWVPELGA